MCVFCLYVNIITLAETQKLVIEVIWQGMGIGHKKAEVGSKALHCISVYIFFHFEPHECSIYLGKKNPQWKNKYNN